MSALAALLEQVSLRRPSLIDLGLARVIRVLERLGAPHKRLPPVFHIAGTNGKGSTAANIRAVLEASGASVHMYTSPHLIRYNERIILAGHEISDHAFMDAIRRVDHAAGEDDLTFFEVITCVAFLAFAETPADYLVLEVGLGGRLDATNVIEHPLASVITPIAFDHMQFLGHSLQEIAYEKAGIFRPGSPAVIGAQQAEVMALLRGQAESIGATPFAMGVEWSFWIENGRLIYQDQAGLSDLSPPRLHGAHQFQNASLAVAALRASGLNMSDDTLSKGLSSTIWPARLQRLKEGPLVKRLIHACAASELWLDGGHNPHAARILGRAMADFEDRDPKPLVLIAGMQENKDSFGFFQEFKGLALAVMAVQADHSGAMPADALAHRANTVGIPSRAFVSVEQALEAALTESAGPLRVLICGSLYLAGQILRNHA